MKRQVMWKQRSGSAWLGGRARGGWRSLVWSFGLWAAVWAWVASPGLAQVLARPQARAAGESAELLQKQLAEWGQERLEQALSAGPLEALNREQLFWHLALARSRFQVSDTTSGFWILASRFPETPEGRASAAILGVDLTEDRPTALLHFGALADLAKAHPEYPLLQWLTGVMARTITRPVAHLVNVLEAILAQRLVTTICPARRAAVMREGAAAYGRFVAHLGGATPPTLVGQTLANMLDDLGEHEEALRYRRMAYAQDQAAWAANGYAMTWRMLERPEEALVYARRAVELEPEDTGYRWELAWSSERVGGGAEAWAEWRRVLAENRAPEGDYVAVATRALRAEQAEAARVLAEDGLERFPRSRLLRVLQARARVRGGDAAAVAEVLEAGTLTWDGQHAPIEAGEDAWRRAILSGDIAAVRGLVDGRALDERETFGHGQTALMVAAGAGWSAIVEELLRRGAAVDLKDNNGNTALHFSTQFNHPACAARLLEAGADVNVQDKWRQTPLIMAVMADSPELVGRMLARPSVDLSLGTPHGGTALHHAASQGRLALLRALIARGADVNAVREKDEATPAMCALSPGRPGYAAAWLLLAAGAAPDRVDAQGRTLLHRSLVPEANEAWVRALLAAGASPEREDRAGITPFELAAWLGHRALAEAMSPAAPAPELPAKLFGDGEAPLTVAERVTLPLRLAAGNFARVRMLAPAEAREQLGRCYGVGQPEGLRRVLAASVAKAPRYTRIDPLKGAAVVSVLTQASLAGASVEEFAQAGLAWRKCERIYLVELARAARWMSAEEAEEWQRGDVAELAASFPKPDDFYAAFLRGARAWVAADYPRLAMICEGLAQASAKRDEARLRWE